jgi:hypothetical protein
MGRVWTLLMLAALSGCYGRGLRADSDDVQYRRLRKTEAETTAALKVLVPKPPEVERNEHGDPVEELDPVVIDIRRMSPEDAQALVVSMANAFSRIGHNTARALAWAKADVIGSGAVEPDRQLELNSEEEHARNAQHLAKESQRAYNLAWWREIVKIYRGAARFYESARFWFKWGGLALSVVLAYFWFKQWRAKCRERGAKEEEKAAVAEAVAALDEIKHDGNGGREMVVKATKDKEHLRHGRERVRAGGMA